MKKISISDLLKESDRKHLIEELSNTNGLAVCIEYPSVFSSAKILRDFVHNIGDYYHIEHTWNSRLTLIADELNNNAIEYGSLKNEINRMHINVDSNGSLTTFRLEVEDSGNGIKNKSADEMNQIKEAKKDASALNHKSIRGRGLFLIIAKIVDTLYFKDAPTGGLIVGIQKSINIK